MTPPSTTTNAPYTSLYIYRSLYSFTLTKLRWIVLDEVDRLLDMGFEQTILEILSTLRGAKLPGLKDKIDPSPSPGSSSARGVGSLQQRYNQQNALRAKQVYPVKYSS